MTITTTTPLNNGIVLTPPETIMGVFPLAFTTDNGVTYTDAYLYYTSTGDCYLQDHVGTATYSTPVVTSVAGSFIDTDNLVLNSSHANPAETFTLLFTSATTYTVTGTVSGALSNNVDYTTDFALGAEVSAMSSDFSVVFFTFKVAAFSGTFDTGDTIVFDTAPADSSTLLFSTGFPITAATLYTALQEVMFVGTAGGYAHVSIPSDGGHTYTMTAGTSGTADFTSVTYSNDGYMMGTDTGHIHTFDTGNFTATDIITLTAPALPEGATLQVSQIKTDFLGNTFLILGNASTNVNSDDPTNYSVVWFGTIDSYNYYSHDFSVTEFVGSHLWLAASGNITNGIGVLGDKYVIAGEMNNIFYSDNGVIWTNTSYINSGNNLTSLDFKEWLFVAGAEVGSIYSSTNGIVWDGFFVAGLATNVIDVS